jgi:hypothetical protein
VQGVGKGDDVVQAAQIHGISMHQDDEYYALDALWWHP